MSEKVRIFLGLVSDDKLLLMDTLLMDWFHQEDGEIHGCITLISLQRQTISLR